jgi:hypothetical protein
LKNFGCILVDIPQFGTFMLSKYSNIKANFGKEQLRKKYEFIPSNLFLNESMN